MPIARFYIKEKNRDGVCLIFLRFYCKPRQLTLSTGCHVRPADWNEKTQRVRKTDPNADSINAVIDGIAEDVTSAEKKLKAAKKAVTPEAVRAMVEKSPETRANWCFPAVRSHRKHWRESGVSRITHTLNLKHMNFDIQKLRDAVNATTREDWWCSVRGADNSKARIFEHKGRIPEGTYFLCDCIGNTIDLCKKTKRKFRNADGRLVACKVVETIIPDCNKKFGTALNGEWVIPYHLFG